ncbi:NrfD/PsrC family molybdoenzyme membrane anchor subunit [Desulfosporosinus metallidurans]|uniref:Tetrathionate reductase subunit C n=1 Tax=Desulfosporosinus metallidurans TaxID=1888891 RepID=A0A1Q8QMP8_9FIRM|nr:NrfD/PsrC family molybdoenzyme membrane anchor subunit [Desulfosporosinus metallidurans]OLN28607.1 Tetrathionate reductase subunit C [Desulfosporosinus metallidurans]
MVKDAKIVKFLLTLGVPLALMVHGYTGFILADIQSRALWHTGLIPLIFLMSAMRINFVIGGQQIPLSGDTLNPYTVDLKHLIFITLFTIAELTILYLAFRILPVYGLLKAKSTPDLYQKAALSKGSSHIRNKPSKYHSS